MTTAPRHRTAQPPERVSVIGLGNMGATLARTFLAAGRAVTVWNRTPSRAAPLATLGAAVASTPGEAVSASPLTVVCVERYENVYDLFAGTAAEAFAGRALVNLTWGSPEDATAMAAWASARGAAYLDGGIPVDPPGIGRPGTSLVYSGPRALWEAHAPVLGDLGGASEYVGERIGAANVVSLAVPGLLFHVAYGAFFEAAAYAATEGVRTRDLRGQVAGAMRLLADSIDASIELIEQDAYATDVTTIWIHLDAMRTACDSLARSGQQATILRGLIDVYERAMEAGHGDEHCAALLGMLRRGG